MIEERAYQDNAVKDASSILKDKGLVVLSMAVRTGKTFTSFGIIKEVGLKSCLFITKKKAIGSVQEDYNTFNSENTHFNIEVVNYEQVHNCKGSYDIIVIDECHSLAQFPKPSKRTKLIKQIAMNKPIIYLSGTVTPESYSGIYHQFWVSSYSPFRKHRSFYGWAKEFVSVQLKRINGGQQIRDYSGGIKERILPIINPYFISISQEEAGFKQKPVEKTVYVQMLNTTKQMFRTLKKDKFVLHGETEIICDTAVKLRSKLLQLCNGSIITTEGEYITLDRSKAEHIKTAYADEKIGIFYIYKSDYEIIKEVFGEHNITNSPEEFNKGDKTFVCQIKSGREGINLKTADRIVMYGIDYSAVSYFQGIHRHQYKDRERPLYIDWIFSDMKLEDKVLKAVQSKKDYTMQYFKKDLKDLL